MPSRGGMKAVNDDDGDDDVLLGSYFDIFRMKSEPKPALEYYAFLNVVITQTHIDLLLNVILSSGGCQIVDHQLCRQAPRCCGHYFM